ncbi:MAG: cytochrome C oxidase subunit IV family protein [Candidatus Methylomirabilis sp.]
MDAHGKAVEHSHPTWGTYLKIAVVLFVLTAIEVMVYFVPFLQTSGLVVPILLALAAVKFALVAMFYMHLKMDHQLFSGLLVFPLIIATAVILALMTLFAYLHRLHPPPPH